MLSNQINGHLSPNMSPVSHMKSNRNVSQSPLLQAKKMSADFGHDDFLNQEDDPELFNAILASLLPGESK